MLEFIQIRCNSDLKKKKLKSVLQVRYHVTRKHEISQIPIVITKSYTMGFQENLEKPYISCF